MKFRTFSLPVGLEPGTWGLPGGLFEEIIEDRLGIKSAIIGQPQDGVVAEFRQYGLLLKSIQPPGVDLLVKVLPERFIQQPGQFIGVEVNPGGQFPQVELGAEVSLLVFHNALQGGFVASGLFGR